MPTELMENSSYIGRIVRHSFGESKNGNPQLGITFELLGRVNPMDPDGELLACEGVERTPPAQAGAWACPSSPDTPAAPA